MLFERLDRAIALEIQKVDAAEARVVLVRRGHNVDDSIAVEIADSRIDTEANQVRHQSTGKCTEIGASVRLDSSVGLQKDDTGSGLAV